jgi:hypothetical protein
MTSSSRPFNNLNITCNIQPYNTPSLPVTIHNKGSVECFLTVFLVTPCSLVDGYRRFGGTFCFHLKV